jgi:hypothetical protein
MKGISAVFSFLDGYHKREEEHRKQAEEPAPEPPRLLAELEEKIRELQPGQVIGYRIQDKTDWTGKGDLTIVVYCGQMEPRRFQDIQDIFSGKKTGHFRPRQGVEG